MSTNKSFSTETSERYSRALFEVGEEAGELAKIEADMNNFQSLHNDSLELKRFIENPTHTIETQNKIISLLSEKLSFSKKQQNDIKWLQQSHDLLSKWTSLFGFLKEDPHEVISKFKEQVLKELGLKKAEVETRLEERNLAREKKNWAESDRIRDELLASGLVLEDKDNTKRYLSEDYYFLRLSASPLFLYHCRNKLKYFLPCTLRDTQPMF